MFNSSEDLSSKNPKKSAYLYVIFGISIFVIITITAIFLFYSNTEPPIVVEDVRKHDEPKSIHEIDTKDIESLRELTENELIYYGDEFTTNRFYSELVILYEITLEKNENNIRALNGMGYSLSKLHLLEDAMQYYSKVLSIDPFNVNAHNGMGVAHMDLGEYDKALDYYQKSLDITTNNVNAYNGLGFTYTNLRNYSQAIENFQKSLRLESFRVESHNGLAFSYFQAGQMNEAEQNYRTALNIDANNLDALLGLALVLSETGQDDEAVKLIQTARDVSNTIESHFINMIIRQGNLLVDSGEYEKAIILYDRVLNLYDNVNALNGKANALIKLGEHDDALLLLDTVLSIDPTNTNAQSIKKLIRQQ